MMQLIPLACCVVAMLASLCPAQQFTGEGESSSGYSFKYNNQRVLLNGPGGLILKYHRQPPTNVDTVTTGGFFHPVKTPAGTTVTALAPDDHPYHRGIFLGWFEMHGETVSGDYWGWGQHAPTEGRRIVPAASPTASVTDTAAGFTQANKWMAKDQVMLREQLKVRAWQTENGRAHVVDLTYTLTPTQDITLPKRAFSGFVFRTRGDSSTITPFDASGQVERAAPHYQKPSTDWPDRPWYAYRIEVPDAKQSAGAAVIDHPDNPKARWHNHTGIGLLNPVITAPGKVTMEANEPFRLRYRAVTFDGEVPTDLLNKLAESW
jgi:hypothetical protein